MNKLEIINDTIADIRDILGAECANIEELPGLIENLQTKASNNGGFTTAFVFSSDTNPTIPTEGVLNTITGVVEGLDAGWTQTVRRDFESEMWMSYSLFDVNGIKRTNWSDPINLKGAVGRNGKDGRDGKDGKDGKDGAQGPQGVQGPAGPRGIQGLQGPQGPAGEDGADGYRFEFIYKRVADETVVVTAPSNEQADFYVPESEGWTGNPCGVTDDLQVEYICQREKIDGVWQDWSNPSIWAMYGKIGRDGNGIEYIYCLTSSEKDVPILPTMDPTKDETDHNFPLVAGKYSWSDDPQSVNLTMSVCWVSVRKQHYLESGNQIWGSLSDPTIWAKYGKDGKEGGGRTIFIYTGSSVYEPSPKIATPVGGTWDVETNVLSGVTTSDEYVWTMNPPVKSETIKYIWQSVGSFNSSGSLVGQWSEPFCITGENGRDGTDGVSKEFIYRLISNKDNFDQLKTWLADEDHKLANTPTGIVPDRNDKIVETDWTDEPSGIDGETYLVEVVCSRKAKLDETGAFVGWDEWSAPTIWAMWGEDGNDGPGVEYIFRVTGPDMTSAELYNEFIANDVFNHTDYQKDGFYPGNEWGVDLDWMDEPQDVDKKQPLEWVSIRKGIVNQETGKVTWGEFSEPKIWGKYSEDGFSYKTSYVFARSNEYPGDPVGGDYTHSYPTVDGSTNGERNPIWFDSVPEGEAIIWMSNRTFRSDNNLSVDDDWSPPVKMSDTADFQVEFTAEDLSKKSGYKPAKFTGNEDKWRATEAAKGVNWADDVPGALYMATATCKNGVWNDWVVVRVKGEQGDRGANGTSVKIEGKFETLEAIQSEWAIYIANPESYENKKFILPLEQGDGYVVEEDGNLWVYDGNGTEFNDAWLNAGKIQGDSAMIYIRFSDNSNGSGMYPEGTVGKYIGIAAVSGEVDSNYLSDYLNYKWAKWSGDDGFGYEQVFIATKINNAPTIPSESKMEEGWVPTNWSDKPISVSETNPFVWYVIRKTDGDWAWKGDRDNPGYAALYSRYSYVGEAFHLELTNDQGIIPLDGGVIDPDFDINTVTTTMVLYSGDKIVTKDVIYTIDNNSAASVSENIVTLNQEAANISSIICTATYKGVDYNKTFHILKTANAYDILTDKVVIERDSETGNLVDSDKQITVWPKKWNGQKWSIANGKMLFVKCYHLNGMIDLAETHLIQNTESISLDLSDEHDLSKIKLYFTEDNTETGIEVCYEEIGVISSGKKGDPGENVNPIAVYLSNPSMELSWFANGIKGHVEDFCKIAAKRGNDPLAITADIIDDCGFGIDIEGNKSYDVTITVTSDVKIDPGTYPVKISLLIDEESIERIIYVNVKELSVAKIEVVMDRTVHVPYLTETYESYDPWEFGETWFDWVPVVGQLWYVVQGAVLSGDYTKTAYIPKTIDLTNIKVFANGVPYYDWNVSDITIGKTSIGRPGVNGRNEYYIVNKANGHIALNLHKVINGFVQEKEHGEFVCYITFDINGFKQKEEVLIIADKTAERYDLKLSQYTMKKGESVKIYFYVDIVSAGGVILNSNPLTKSGPKIELFTRSISEKDGKACEWSQDEQGTYIELNNIQETQVFAIWVYDANNNKIAHCKQNVTCLYQEKIETWSIKSATPFVKINQNAIVGDGLLVGNPISLVIQHQIGDASETFDRVPEGYQITLSYGDGDDGIYKESGESLTSLDDSNLYKTTSPLTFTLYRIDDVNDYGEFVDKVTIEKTIVYPEPIIYPAGEYTVNKSYKISYSQVPYIFIKTSSGDIKYYVGNRDVLKDRLDDDLMNTITINGNDIEILPIKDYLAWNPMESFEAIYADIGVFKQALVGPMVFYKDYVFSQMGTMLVDYKDWKKGDTISYEDMFKAEAEWDNLIKLWQPNYLLNCRTGQLLLESKGDVKSQIKFGKNLTIGGEEEAIVVTEDLETDGVKHTGHLKIGTDSGLISAATYGDTPGPNNSTMPFGRSLTVTMDDSMDCYGGGILSIDSFDFRDENSPIAATHCVGLTNDAPKRAPLSLSSTSGASFVNVAGGIYGFRTGTKALGNNETLDLSITCASFAPQTIIVQSGNEATLKLPKEESSEAGDCFEIWAAGTLHIVSQNTMWWKFATNKYDGQGTTPSIGGCYARIVYTGSSWWMVYW